MPIVEIKIIVVPLANKVINVACSGFSPIAPMNIADIICAKPKLSGVNFIITEILIIKLNSPIVSIDKLNPKEIEIQ